MNVLQRHESPDGLLCLLVGDVDGDTCIGFDGFTWHTHGDILASLSGLSEIEAISTFVSEILSGQRVIAVSRVPGTIREAWVSDDPGADLKYKPEEEYIEFRYWDGTNVAEPVTPPNSHGH